MSAKPAEIILAGTGGQGLILAGVVLAKAAVLEGKNVVQTQSYGTQSRGGYSQAEVLISRNEIYFPKSESPDLVLALSQAAYDRYCSKVSEGCRIIFDADSVQGTLRANDIGFGFTSTAIELGNERVINSLALGAAVKLFPVVAVESVLTELEKGLPAKAFALNREAFYKGYSAS